MINLVMAVIIVNGPSLIYDISDMAASRPKFTILWGHVEDILLLNKFFSDCR